MRFEYVCRYCKQPVGSIDHAAWSYDDGAKELGITHLDEDHRREVVASTPDQVHVQTVCEHCEEAVRMNPELLVEGHIIQ